MLQRSSDREKKFIARKLVLQIKSHAPAASLILYWKDPAWKSIHGAFFASGAARLWRLSVKSRTRIPAGTHCHVCPRFTMARHIGIERVRYVRCVAAGICARWGKKHNSRAKLNFLPLPFALVNLHLTKAWFRLHVEKWTHREQGWMRRVHKVHALKSQGHSSFPFRLNGSVLEAFRKRLMATLSEKRTWIGGRVKNSPWRNRMGGCIMQNSFAFLRCLAAAPLSRNFRPGAVFCCCHCHCSPNTSTESHELKIFFQLLFLQTY